MVLRNLLLIGSLLFFELLHELVDLLLLLVEDLVFLGFSLVTLLLSQVLLDLLDVPLVGLYESPKFCHVLLPLLDLSVVLLDAVEETLTSFGEGEVELVGLEFEVLLALEQ